MILKDIALHMGMANRDGLQDEQRLQVGADRKDEVRKGSKMLAWELVAILLRVEEVEKGHEDASGAISDETKEELKMLSLRMKKLPSRTGYDDVGEVVSMEDE